MGVENHNAVLATTWNRKQESRIMDFIEALAPIDKRLFVWGDSLFNGFATVIMLPDGSKEGWEDSDYYDELRDKFIKQLEACKYSDGSNSWKWIEVGWGEYGQKVIRGNNVNCYSDDEYYIYNGD